MLSLGLADDVVFACQALQANGIFTVAEGWECRFRSFLCSKLLQEACLAGCISHPGCAAGQKGLLCTCTAVGSRLLVVAPAQHRNPLPRTAALHPLAHKHAPERRTLNISLAVSGEPLLVVRLGA